MKDFVTKLRGAALAIAAAAFFMLPSEGALAQVVSQLPTAIVANSVVDFGNGPLELKTVLGNAWVFTSQGNNGSANSADSASTTLTLTNTPTTPPCVGCGISGSGITPGTTVAAYNGTTTITLSAAMTIPANTLITWGAACPAFSGVLPAPNIGLQPGNPDLPLYSYTRICGYAANGPGAQVLAFPIGAH